MDFFEILQTPQRRWNFRPARHLTEEQADKYRKKLESVKPSSRRAPKRTKRAAPKLAWDDPYVPPKSAIWKVRIFYISLGDELLSCDSGCLSIQAAESLIDRLQGDAIFLQKVYAPSNEITQTYYYREFDKHTKRYIYVGGLVHSRIMASGYHETPYNEHRIHQTQMGFIPEEVLEEISKARHVILPSQKKHP